MDRPVTTLFMLMPVDGKISTGSTDEMDVDRDFPKISGVKEGLHQYYEIEQTTDLWSFNTGRVHLSCFRKKSHIKLMVQKTVNFKDIAGQHPPFLQDPFFHLFHIFSPHVKVPGTYNIQVQPKRHKRLYEL